MNKNKMRSELFLEAYDSDEEGNVEKAIQLYEKAVALDDISSCLNLGYIYNRGRGVKKDDVKALSLYKKAWRLGNKFPSCSDIAHVYMDRGRNDLAVKWFTKAVDSGSGTASVEFAKLLLKSKRKPDLEKAKKLLQFALTKEEMISITGDAKDEAQTLLDDLG